MCDPLHCQIPLSWSSPVALLSMPHLRTALAINERHIPKPGGHLYEVMHCVETCATGSNTLYSLNLRQTWVIWAVPPSILHSCAALVTHTEHVSDCTGHSCEITWHAEACTTASNCTQLLNPAELVQPTVSIPKLTTLVRSLRNPTDTLAVGLALYTTSCVAWRPAQPFIYSRFLVHLPSSGLPHTHV